MLKTPHSACQRGIGFIEQNVNNWPSSMPSPVATILSERPTRRPSASFRRPAIVIRISTVEKSRRDSMKPVSRQSPNQLDRPRRMPKMVAAGGATPICLDATGPRPVSGWAAEAAGGSLRGPCDRPAEHGGYGGGVEPTGGGGCGASPRSGSPHARPVSLSWLCGAREIGYVPPRPSAWGPTPPRQPPRQE